MAYQYLPSDLAKLQVDQEDIKRRQQMAQAFQQAGFNPVQNGNQALTLLASLASTLRGNSMMKDASKSLTENLSQQFEAQNAQAQAEAEAKRAEEDRKFQRELEKLQKGEQFKAQYAQRNIDPNSPEGIAAQLQLAKGKASLQPKTGPAQPQFAQQLEYLRSQGVNVSPDELKQIVAGIKPEQTPKTPALTAEAKNKLALINNAIANATKYKERTVNGQDFNDIAAHTNDTPQLIKSAIQDMLYAKSGASAPVEEVQKAEAMFGPGMFEKDSTAAAKVQNFINDLTRMRDEIGGSGIPGEVAGTAAQGQPPSTDAPPVPGAQKAPDGNWYVQQNGKFLRVDP